MKIYIDADACPVKLEVLRVAERHGIEVLMVSNSWMRLPESPLVRRVMVGDKLDAADDWIAAEIGTGDIAVTSDIPLAARCLEAGAAALAPTGRPFTRNSIGMALAMRELMADLRAMGEAGGGNAGFTRADRSRFLQALEQAVQEARKA